eukprot:263216_1
MRTENDEKSTNKEDTADKKQFRQQMKQQWKPIGFKFFNVRCSLLCLLILWSIPIILLMILGIIFISHTVFLVIVIFTSISFISVIFGIYGICSFRTKYVLMFGIFSFIPTISFIVLLFVGLHYGGLDSIGGLAASLAFPTVFSVLISILTFILYKKMKNFVPSDDWEESPKSRKRTVRKICGYCCVCFYCVAFIIIPTYLIPWEDVTTTDESPETYKCNHGEIYYGTHCVIIDSVDFQPINNISVDPFGRVEISVNVQLSSNTTINVSDINFIWDIQEEEKWLHIVGTFINNEQQAKNQYKATVIVNSIRTLKSGYCYDNDIASSHIFQPGNNYKLRLKTSIQNMSIGNISDPFIFTISTKTLPSHGNCLINNSENLTALDPFYLDCTGWNDVNSSLITYNALIGSTLISSDGFVIDSSELTGIIPVGLSLITVLIKNEDNGVTCFDINNEFKVSDNVIDSIETIIGNSTSTINSTDTISLFSVVNYLYNTSNLNKSKATDLTTNLVENVFENSMLFDENQTDYIYVPEYIVSETATFVTLTSNPHIVDSQVVNKLTNHIPNILNATQQNTNNFVESNSIAIVVLDLINNLETSLTTANITDTQFNKLAQNLADYDTKTASIALTHSLPGDIYLYEKVETNTDGSISFRKRVSARKFDINVHKNQLECGSFSENVVFSPQMMKQQNINGLFDCSVSSSTRNIFKSKNKSTSGVVTVRIFNTESDQDISNSPTNSSTNSPSNYYYIHIDVSEDNISLFENEWKLGNSIQIPSCAFWNTSMEKWDNTGCYLYDYNKTNGSIVCACNHLTSFSSFAEEWIIPEVNQPIKPWNMNPKHLIKYPIVWLTFVIILFIFIIIGYLNPASRKGSENRSFLAYEDIIYKDVRLKKIKDDLVGQQLDYISSLLPNQDKAGHGIKTISNGHKKQICKLHWKLFLIDLRNDHTLLSLFQRASGTNYSTRQRLGCFFMFLSTLMVATAIFYGVEQGNMTKRYIASFLSSLLSTTPVLIVKQLFFNSKPKIIPSEVEEDFSDFEDNDDDDDNVNENENDIDIEEGTKYAKLKTTATGRGSALQNIRMTKSYANAIDTIAQHKRKTSIKTLNTALLTAEKEQSRKHKFLLVEHVRHTLLNSVYPLPYKFKKLAWIMIIIWSVACAILAILYGLQFDLEFENTSNTNTFVPLKERLKDELRENKYKTYAWLISLFTSLLTSMILWQPLTVYITSWIKLVQFTYNLSMGLGPPKLIALFKKCCGCNNELDELKSLNKQISNALQLNSTGDDNEQIVSVVAHINRPLDLLGFLGNDSLFLEKINTSNKERNENEKK